MADLQTVRVFGFAGSLRKGSYNRMALRAAGDLLPPGMTLETFDLTPIPPYNEDVRALGFPAPVQEFRDRIAAADALLIVTPEYNYSMPGVLKNAIDWASRPRPVSHSTASRWPSWGQARACWAQRGPSTICARAACFSTCICSTGRR